MNAKRINLLPRDVTPKAELSPEMLCAGVGVFCVALIGALTLSNQLTVTKGERQLASLQAEKTSLDAKVAAFKEKNDRISERQARLTSFREVVNRKIYWVEMFKELAALMPKEVWLTSLNSTISEHDKRITLKGEAASQEKVAEFLKALEKSVYFNAIVMKVSEKQDDYHPNLYKFEFNVPVPEVKGGKT